MRVIRRAIIDEQAGEMTLTTAERLHFGAERVATQAAFLSANGVD